jgi:hypothetical protein
LNYGQAIMPRNRSVVGVIVQALGQAYFEAHPVDVSFALTKRITLIDQVEIATNSVGQLVQNIDRYVE